MKIQGEKNRQAGKDKLLREIAKKKRQSNEEKQRGRKGNGNKKIEIKGRIGEWTSPCCEKQTK